jgi:hypothetical protein
MMRWGLVLVPLLACGLMCFGGVILAALGLRKATETRTRPDDSRTTAVAPADRIGDEHVEV